MSLAGCARRYTATASSIASSSKARWLGDRPLPRATFATEATELDLDPADHLSRSSTGYFQILPEKEQLSAHATPRPGETDLAFRWRMAWALAGHRHPPIPAPDFSELDLTPATPWRPGVRRVGCVGKKLGSITMWDANGESSIVHVVRLLNNFVFKVEEHETHSTVYVSGGGTPLRSLEPAYQSIFRHARVPSPKYFDTFKVHKAGVPPLFSMLRAIHFVPGQWLDVKGKTRERGVQGAMVRHGFSGGPATHGTTKFHRRLGSISSRGMGTIKPGTKMAGHMGGIGHHSPCQVVRIDTELDLVYLKGNIPGNKDNWVSLQDAHRWHLKAEKNKHGIVGLPFPAGTYEMQRRLGAVPKEITLLEMGKGQLGQDPAGLY